MSINILDFFVLIKHFFELFDFMLFYAYVKKKLTFVNFFFNQNGNVLLSQAVSHQVS